MRCRYLGHSFFNGQILDNSYSAFGSTDPLFDPEGDRIRWFCPWYIESPSAAERALALLAKLEGEVNSSRITFRAVSHGALSSSLENLFTQRGYRVEAVMPLGDEEDRRVNYIGRCTGERQSLAEDGESERSLVAAIRAKPRKGPKTLRQEFEEREGYQIELVESDTLSADDKAHLIALHKDAFPIFPYDFAVKLSLMLNDPGGYIICMVRSLEDGKIRAFSNLEINTVHMSDGSHVTLAEYDNSIRQHDPENPDMKGLGAAIRLELAILAARRQVDLCHAESRASLAPVNANSYNLGMHFGGTLEKHLQIGGRSTLSYQRPSRFESMNVWYLNRTDLKMLSRY